MDESEGRYASTIVLCIDPFVFIHLSGDLFVVVGIYYKYMRIYCLTVVFVSIGQTALKTDRTRIAGMCIVGLLDRRAEYAPVFENVRITDHVLYFVCLVYVSAVYGQGA